MRYSNINAPFITVVGILPAIPKPCSVHALNAPFVAVEVGILPAIPKPCSVHALNLGLGDLLWMRDGHRRRRDSDGHRVLQLQPHCCVC